MDKQHGGQDWPLWNPILESPRGQAMFPQHHLLEPTSKLGVEPLQCSTSHSQLSAWLDGALPHFHPAVSPVSPHDTQGIPEAASDEPSLLPEYLALAAYTIPSPIQGAGFNL